MRVLIISDAWHPQVNGVVRTYEHLCEELEALGHTTGVIGPADFPRCISMPGYSEIKLALAPYRRLKKLITAFKADHIHIATEGPLGWAARKYCMRNEQEFTTSYHTHFPDYTAKRVAKFLPFLYKPVHAISRNIVKRFHKASQGMFIATQSLEDELRSWGFETKIYRLSRGANFDLFYPEKTDIYKDLPRPIALYVGRIAIEKSIEDFLKTPFEGSKVIVGDGPSREELEEKYPDAHFVGIKQGEDLANHYRGADLFVFPSRTDTFGMVLVEALACGLPVAAYNVTGPKDIITQPLLGALHDNDLSKAIQAALNTTANAQERHNFVKDNYSWQAVGKQFEAGIKDTI